MSKRVPELTHVVKMDDRRIMACIDACAGISTEALEDNAVRGLVDALTRIKAGLDAGAVNAAAIHAICRAAIAKVKP